MQARSRLFHRLLVAGVACVPAAVLASHHVVSPTTSSSNDDVEISATITLAEPEVAQKIGVDPGTGVVLVEVHVLPKTDKDLRVSPDDFYLLSHDDGQRSQPFEPAQLAGRGALVVSPTAGAGGGTRAERYGIPLGSVTLPGGMVGVGGGGRGPGTLSSKADNKSSGDPALLKALKAKQLPDKLTTKEVSGYLYFPFDGKHKLKNLAVLYRGQAGRLDLEFEH
jgi:hypothetical protein